jgi:transposase
MDIIHPHVAGIDVHKKQISVAVRLPGQMPGERQQTVRTFRTFWRALRQMADWLAELGVTDVAMEATDVIRGSNKFLPPFSRSWPSRTCP